MTKLKQQVKCSLLSVLVLLICNACSLQGVPERKVPKCHWIIHLQGVPERKVPKCHKAVHLPKMCTRIFWL
jgi:hypothetical protein